MASAHKCTQLSGSSRSVVPVCFLLMMHREQKDCDYFLACRLNESFDNLVLFSPIQS